MRPQIFIDCFEGKYGDLHTLWAAEEFADNGRFYYHYDYSSKFCYESGSKLYRNIIIAKSDGDAIQYLRVFLLEMYKMKSYQRRYKII